MKSPTFSLSTRTPIFLGAASLALCLLATGPAAAAERTWSATPTNGDWDNAANWNTLPVPSLDSLLFGASTITALNNNFSVGSQFNGLTFGATAGAYTLSGNGINLGGNVTNNSSNTQTIDLPLTLTLGRTFTTNGLGGNLVVGPVGGAFAITKSGLGTLTLTGVNTYTNTTINLGSIIYGSATLPGVVQTLGTLAVAAGGDVSVVSQYGNSGSSSLTFTTQTYNAGGVLNYVVSGGTNGVDNQIRISGAQGFVNKQAFFNGADYAFRNELNGFLRAPVYGTDLGFDSAVGALVAASHNQVSASISDQASVAVNTIKFTGAGAVDLTQLEASTITFNGNSGILRSGGGSTTISGGNIANATGIAYVVRADTVADSLTINSNILGVGTNTFTKSGAGTVTLGGANTYTGSTFVIGGTLTINGTSLSSAYQSNGPASILNLNGVNTATGAATVLAQNGGTVNVNAVQNYTGVTSVLTNGTLGIGADNAIPGTILFNVGNIRALGGARVISSALDITGPMTVTGSNALTFNSVFSNKLTGAAIAITANNTALTTFAGGIEIRNGLVAGARTLTINGTGNVSVTGPITSGGGNDGTANASALLYTGSGTVVSSGTNTYNGTTTFNSGAYMLNGSHILAPSTTNNNSTAYTFNGASRFGGTGVLNTETFGVNTVTMNGTSELAAGDSTLPLAQQTGVLDLNVVSLTMNTGTTFAAQLGGATPGDGSGFYDQVNITHLIGSITLNGTVNLSLSLVNSFTPAPTDVFYILTKADEFVAFTTFFAGAGEGAIVDLGGGYVGQITYLANWTGSQGGSSLTGGNDVAIYNVAAIPEPGTWLLLGAGLLFAVVFGRRRAMVTNES